MSIPSGGSNAAAVHEWVKSLPGTTTREQCLRGLDIAVAEQSRAGAGSEDWHRWATVFMAVAEFLRIDNRPSIGDLLESAQPAEQQPAAIAA